MISNRSCGLLLEKKIYLVDRRQTINRSDYFCNWKSSAINLVKQRQKLFRHSKQYFCDKRLDDRYISKYFSSHWFHCLEDNVASEFRSIFENFPIQRLRYKWIKKERGSAVISKKIFKFYKKIILSHTHTYMSHM